MAYIGFSDGVEIEYLRDYHRIGRKADAVDTRLDYPFISKLHAVVEWQEPNWLIRDLSQNGVWVNGERLPAQVRHVLKINDYVELAGSKGISFTVLDISKPENMIYKNAAPLETVALHYAVILPNESDPKLGLYKCFDRMQWFAEHLGKTSDINDSHHPYESGPYEHDDLIHCAGDEWRVFLIGEDDITTEFQIEQPAIKDVEFRFDVSQNEESTSLTLIHGHQEIDLGERSHHYLLVHLLRHKFAQVQSQQSAEQNPDAAGWMSCEVVESELGIEESHLNIQIFRARKQILASVNGYAGSSRIIERRRGALRMGIDNYSIYKEGVREI